MPDPTPTDIDISRLMVFATLREGKLPNIPHRSTPTYERLKGAGLVSLIDDDLEIPGFVAGDFIAVLRATITPLGRDVVAAALAAARGAMG